MRFAFVLRELQQAQRPFDVHFVRGDRSELRACRKQCGEMKNEIALELREDTLENPFVGDGAGELAADLPGQCGFEGGDVDGDDRTSGLGKLGDEAVADFTVRARDEHGWSAHLVGGGYEFPSSRSPMPPRIEPSSFRLPPMPG